MKFVIIYHACTEVKLNLDKMRSNALPRGEGQAGTSKVFPSASEVRKCDFCPRITYSNHDV